MKLKVVVIITIIYIGSIWAMGHFFGWGLLARTPTKEELKIKWEIELPSTPYFQVGQRIYTKQELIDTEIYYKEVIEPYCRRRENEKTN